MIQRITEVLLDQMTSNIEGSFQDEALTSLVVLSSTSPKALRFARSVSPNYHAFSGLNPINTGLFSNARGDDAMCMESEVSNMVALLSIFNCFLSSFSLSINLL